MITFLAAFYTSFVACVFVFTRRQPGGWYLAWLLIGFIPYVIRPLLATEVGCFTMYGQSSDCVLYVEAYTLAVFSQVVFGGGYICRSLTERRVRLKAQGLQTKISAVPYVFLSILIFVGLFLKYDVSWLGPLRTTAASIVAPEFRYAYPVVVFCCLFLAVASAANFATRPLLLPLLLGMAFCFAAITLLNTRGWFVTVVLVNYLVIRNAVKTRLNPILLAVVALLLYVGAYELRGLLDSYFGGAALLNSGSLADRLRWMFLYTASGDAIDVWYLVLEYLKANSHLNGLPELNYFLTVLPGHERARLGLFTTGDLLNAHLLGGAYFETGLGVATNNFQDLYLNFGLASLFLLAPMGFAYRALEARTFRTTPNSSRSVYFVICSLALLNVVGGSLANLSWLLVFLLLASGGVLVTRFFSLSRRGFARAK